MATIANKFLYFSTVAAYNAAKTNIANGSIVFVNQEAGENVEAQRFIVTHGKEFHANLAADSIKTAIEALDVTNLTNSDATDRGVTITLNEVDGKITSITISDLGGAKLGSYTKGSDSSALAAGDTIAAALAKLENQIAAEATARANADTAINDKIGTGFDSTNTVAKAISDEATARGNADTAIQDQIGTGFSSASGNTIAERVVAAEGAITTLNGNNTVTGSVDKKIKDAIDALDYTIESHTAGKAVTAVSEANGVIAVTEGNIDAQYVNYTPQGEDGAKDTNNTNVQTVLAEIFQKIAENEEAGEVAVYKGETKVSAIAADGETYTIKQGTTDVATINIAKDMVVSSGSVITADGTETDVPTGTTLVTGKKYVRLVIKDSTDGKNIYIAVDELYDDYSFTDSSEIDFTESNNDVTASIKTGSIAESKLDSALQAKIAGARTVLVEIAQTDPATKHITVTKTTGTGSTPDSYTIAEHDIASAAALTQEISDRQSGDAALLGASTDASTANTIYGAKKGVEEAKTAAAEAKTVVNAKNSGHVTVSVDSTAADGHAVVTVSENDIASAALVGTLPSGATATTVVGYAAEIASDEADAAETAAKSYADTITVNSKGKANNSQNILIDGSDIALTGYTAKSGAGNGDVAATDTVNAAIKKVETKVDNLDTASPFEYSNSSNKATVLKGSNLTAQNASEVAVGQYNVSTSGKTQFSVGIGAANAQKNGIEVQNDGTIIIYPYTSSGTFSTTAAILQEILHNEIDWYEG